MTFFFFFLQVQSVIHPVCEVCPSFIQISCRNFQKLSFVPDLIHVNYFPGMQYWSWWRSASSEGLSVFVWKFPAGWSLFIFIFRKSLKLLPRALESLWLFLLHIHMFYLLCLLFASLFQLVEFNELNQLGMVGAWFVIYVNISNKLKCRWFCKGTHDRVVIFGVLSASTWKLQMA